MRNNTSITRFSSYLNTDVRISSLWGFRSAYKEGVVAYDCLDQEEVLLRPYALFFAGDNPMQCEECSGAGLNANHFCRTCEVGGTQEYKRSDEGFAEIFKVDEPALFNQESRLQKHQNLILFPLPSRRVEFAHRMRPRSTYINNF